MVVVFQAVHYVFIHTLWIIQCVFLEVSQPHGILTGLKVTLGNVKQFQIAVLIMPYVVWACFMQDMSNSCITNLFQYFLFLKLQPQLIYNSHYAGNVYLLVLSKAKR